MTTKEVIEKLELAKIKVKNVEDRGNYELVTISGGFGNEAMTGVYLYQIKDIIECFEERENRKCWIISLNNNPLEDKWILKIGVRKQ